MKNKRLKKLPILNYLYLFYAYLVVLLGKALEHGHFYLPTAVFIPLYLYVFRSSGWVACCVTIICFMLLFLFSSVDCRKGFVGNILSCTKWSHNISTCSNIREKYGKNVFQNATFKKDLEQDITELVLWAKQKGLSEVHFKTHGQMMLMVSINIIPELETPVKSLASGESISLTLDRFNVSIKITLDKKTHRNVLYAVAAVLGNSQSVKNHTRKLKTYRANIKLLA